MPHVFIALENAASAFGHKKRNTNNKQTEAKSRPEKKRSEQKYADRQAMADAAGYAPAQDASEGTGEGSIHLTVGMVANKKGYKLGVSGSLPSMFKRLAFEAANGSAFDTLVFMGHGNTGLMTVGLGQAPLDKLAALKGKHATTYANYTPDKRMINVSDDNKRHWCETFHANGKHLGSNRNSSVFSVFFLGCSTGNKSETSFKILPQVVAPALMQLLNCNVICYGTDNEIDNDDIEAALTNLESVMDAVGGLGGLKGSYQLTTGVSLEWYRADVA